MNSKHSRCEVIAPHARTHAYNCNEDIINKKRKVVISETIGNEFLIHYFSAFFQSIPVQIIASHVAAAEKEKGSHQRKSEKKGISIGKSLAIKDKFWQRAIGGIA